MKEPMTLRDELVQHLLRALEATNAEDKPFAHCYIQGLFPEDVYAEMVQAFPDPECYEITGVETRTFLELTPDLLEPLGKQQRELWWSVGAALRSREFRQALFRKLQRGLGRRFGARTDLDSIEAYPRPALFRDTSGYKIPPHPDTRKKVVTMQIFLPRDDTQMELGTSIYKPTFPLVWALSKRAGLKKVKQFPFAQNSGYAFAVVNRPLHASWHGRDLVETEGVRHTLINVYYAKPELGYVANSPRALDAMPEPAAPRPR